MSKHTQRNISPSDFEQEKKDNFMDKSQIEQQLKKIILLIPGNVYWKDKEGRYLGCNNNVAKILKLSSPDDIIGKRNHELFNGELAMLADDIDFQVIKNNTEFATEEVGLNAQGEEAIYFSRKIPLHDEEGNPNGILGISVDITEKKREEIRLKEAYQEIDKVNAGLKLIAASIAHELRTPLSAISSAVSGTIKHLPPLIATYQLAKEKKLPIPFIPNYRIDLLSNINNNVQQEINAANLIINMLLTKINQPANVKTDVSTFSISNCINTALKRYPLSQEESALIHWKPSHDFSMIGSPLLIIHILFNLLKNALYYIKAAGKGEIAIWLESEAEYNNLYFKDTGEGINMAILPHIFDRFFSKTRGGAGVGLAFCKEAMKDMGGDIICTSIEGEYSLFKLTFPK